MLFKTARTRFKTARTNLTKLPRNRRVSVRTRPKGKRQESIYVTRKAPASFVVTPASFVVTCSLRKRRKSWCKACMPVGILWINQGPTPWLKPKNTGWNYSLRYEVSNSDFKDTHPQSPRHRCNARNQIKQSTTSWHTPNVTLLHLRTW